MSVRARATEWLRGRARARPVGAAAALPLLADRATAAELSRIWRSRHGRELDGRRRMLAGYLTASAAMGVIALYQTGLTRRLPELPLPGFEAPRVDASAQAYQLLGVPDAVVALLSNATTMTLVAAGGEHRPAWLRALTAAKVGVDAAYAAKLTADQATKHRAACSWCLLSAFATWSAVAEAVRQAR